MTRIPYFVFKSFLKKEILTIGSELPRGFNKNVAQTIPISALGKESKTVSTTISMEDERAPSIFTSKEIASKTVSIISWGLTHSHCGHSSLKMTMDKIE